MKRSDVKISLDSVLIELRSMNDFFVDSDSYDLFCEAYCDLSFIRNSLLCRN